MPAEMKTFELRDRMTMIPAVAVRIIASGNGDDYLWRRAGYGIGDACVLLTNLVRNATKYDAAEWNDRTMRQAHLHIERYWNDLENGAVIDVEYILGETQTPKTSERHGSME